MPCPLLIATWLCRGHNLNEETCHGLALQRDYLDTDDYQDMRSGVIWASLCDPCDNCNALINWYGGDINNFGPDTESDGAPPWLSRPWTNLAQNNLQLRKQHGSKTDDSCDLPAIMFVRPSPTLHKSHHESLCTGNLPLCVRPWETISVPVSFFNTFPPCTPFLVPALLRCQHCSGSCTALVRGNANEYKLWRPFGLRFWYPQSPGIRKVLVSAKLSGYISSSVTLLLPSPSPRHIFSPVTVALLSLLPLCAWVDNQRSWKISKISSSEFRSSQ